MTLIGSISTTSVTALVDPGRSTPTISTAPELLVIYPLLVVDVHQEFGRLELILSIDPTRSVVGVVQEVVTQVRNVCKTVSAWPRSVARAPPSVGDCAPPPQSTETATSCGHVLDGRAWETGIVAADPRSGRARSASARTVLPDQLRPAPVVLVVGSEELLADRAVAAVITAARADDPDLVVENVDAAGYESGQLALLASPSLFGGGTVIVVTGAESTSPSLVEDLKRYLRTPDPQICLVLRHAGGNRAKALLNAARAAGAPEASCQPITRGDEKVEFAAAEFRRMSVKASPHALRALVDAVGSNLRELASACEQLVDDVAATGDKRVDVNHVDARFGGRIEVTGFRVADVTVAGRADQALSLLRHALATGADPVLLVAALAVKIRALAKVSTAGRGRSEELASFLGMASWQIDRARRDLSGWNEEGLATAILAVAEADAAVKGGGRDPVFAVEKAVLTIATARG